MANNDAQNISFCYNPRYMIDIFREQNNRGFWFSVDSILSYAKYEMKHKLINAFSLFIFLFKYNDMN